jgi:hypothetical protein
VHGLVAEDKILTCISATSYTELVLSIPLDMASLGPGSNDAPQAASRDTNVGWYDPPITTVGESTRELLEQYAHFPPDEVIARLMEAVSIPYFGTRDIKALRY